MPNHRAWQFYDARTLRFEQTPTPAPAPTGVIVRVETAMVLSYHREVLDGTRNYALPPAPFVPGTDAVGVVEAVGSQVVHVKAGQRVLLIPHLVIDERTTDPAQILVGHTALGTLRNDEAARATRALQAHWRDGCFAEKAHWPAAAVTALDGLEQVSSLTALALSRLIVPYGGLLRARLEPGHVVIVNGATGQYGSAGVMVALAMGASRVVAAGRNAAVLHDLAASLGPRVAPAVLTGDWKKDIGTLLDAAGGRADLALDLLGEATSTETTLATLRALRRGGRLALMGTATVPLPLVLQEMMVNDWEVMGVFMYPKNAPAQLVRLAASGLLDLTRVRPHSFPLSDFPEAMDAAAAMKGLDLAALVA